MLTISNSFQTSKITINTYHEWGYCGSHHGSQSTTAKNRTARSWPGRSSVGFLRDAMWLRLGIEKCHELLYTPHTNWTSPSSLLILFHMMDLTLHREIFKPVDIRCPPPKSDGSKTKVNREKRRLCYPYPPAILWPMHVSWGHSLGPRKDALKSWE